MKKRVLSMFMALALCLTLLSATALAEGAEGGAAQIGEKTYSTLSEAVDAAKDGDTIKLLADYKTVKGAGDEEDDGLTITKSVTLDLNGYKMDYFRVAQVNDAGETLPSGNLIVEDTSAEKAGKVTEMIKLLAGKLTINGGTIGNGREGVEIENGNLTVNGGAIDFLYGSNSGTVTITGGTVKNARFAEDFEITVTGGSGHTGLWDVSEGTWSISGGEFGEVTFKTESPVNNAPISGGTFEKITRKNLQNNAETLAPLSGLLADGYAFYEQTPGSEEYDRCVKLDDMITSLENVQVKPHTHNFTGNDNVCTGCGKAFGASVTARGSVSYYDTIDSAFAAAQTNDTVTLLADITNRGGSGIFVSGGPYTLDLNGHRIEAGIDLMVGDMDGSGALLRGELTVKDSSTNNAGYVQSLKLWNGDLTVESGSFHWIVESTADSVGTITITGGTAETVTHCSPNVTFRLSGGTFDRISISSTCGENVFPSDLLADGYAYANKTSGAIQNGEGYSEVSDVTVQQAPITSVTLTAMNANNTAASTTMPYGTTGGIKLFAHCNPKPGVTGLSCQWYTIGDSAALIPEATGPFYPLPTNLSVGEHKYRVTATADGYSKSADITITVEKIDLANATVTIDPWHADGKFRFNPYAPKTAALSFLSAVKVTANGKEDRLSDSDFTYTGATATRVGKYTLTITATDSCANFKGSKAIPWEVIPHQLYRPAFQGSQTYTKTYDGTTTLPGSYT